MGASTLATAVVAIVAAVGYTASCQGVECAAAANMLNSLPVLDTPANLARLAVGALNAEAYAACAPHLPITPVATAAVATMLQYPVQLSIARGIMLVRATAVVQSVWALTACGRAAHVIPTVLPARRSSPNAASAGGVRRRLHRH